MTEYRSVPSTRVKVVDDSKHQLEIESTVYNVVDDYNTRFRPGVWTRSLELRKPPLCWAHDWKEPIGSLVDYTDSDKSLRTLYQLDDFEAVPRARQAWAQYHSGTVTDASFGFSHGKDEPAAGDGLEGVRDYHEADLDENSIVLRGAVPGVKLVGSRGVMPTEFLGIARSLEAGELTLEQALTIVGRAVDSPDLRSMHSHAKQGVEGSVSHSHVGDISGTHAHSGLMPRAAGRDGSITSTDRAGAVGEVKCPKCGAMNSANAKVCDQCGAKMPSAGKPEAEHDAIDEADARRLLAAIA